MQAGWNDALVRILADEHDAPLVLGAHSFGTVLGVRMGNVKAQPERFVSLMSRVRTTIS